MRKIAGELSNTHASRFADFLLTQGIETMIEAGREDRYEIWAKHEDQLSEAKILLDEFTRNPDADRFQVDRQAEELRKKQQKERQAKLKLQQKFKPRSSTLGGSNGRFTIGIIVVCVVASLLTDFGSFRRFKERAAMVDQPFQLRLYNQLTLVPQLFEVKPGEDKQLGPMDAVLGGQVWRLITPIFLHGSPMHLLFNCMFLYSFGRIIEAFYGPLFLLALFLGGGVAGLFAQVYGPAFLNPSPYVIGASGGALSLFSFLWLRPKFEPSLPFRVSQINIILVLGFVFVAMIPAVGMRSIAHLAHLGGLIWGGLVATGFLNFLRR